MSLLFKAQTVFKELFLLLVFGLELVDLKGLAIVPGRPKVDPMGLLCLDVFEDEHTAFSDELEGDEAGGLVTSASHVGSSPDSSEEEWSVMYGDDFEQGPDLKRKKLREINYFLIVVLYNFFQLDIIPLVKFDFMDY